MILPPWVEHKLAPVAKPLEHTHNMSDHSPHQRQHISADSGTPPSEPRAWIDTPAPLPDNSAPSISTLLQDYIESNELLSNEYFLDIFQWCQYDSGGTITQVNEEGVNAQNGTEQESK